MRVHNKVVQNTNTQMQKSMQRNAKKNHLYESAHFPPLLSVTSAANNAISIRDSWDSRQFTSFDSFKHTKSITQNAALQTPTSITIYAPGSSIYSQCGCSPVIENNVWGPDFVPGQSGVCDVVVPANNFISFHVLLIYFDNNFFLNRTRECFSEHIGLEYDVIVMSN